MFDIQYVNTATSPVTPTRVMNPSPLNYNADFRVVSEANGETVLTNISAPLTKPEQIRMSVSAVADIFKGSKIDPPVVLPGTISSFKSGTSVLIQMTGVGSDAQSIAFPYSVHLVLKVPTGTDVDAGALKIMLERLLGCLYDTGSETPDSRLMSLIRGALTPTDL